MLKATVLLITAGMLVSGCGQTRADRALSGAAIGAGTGAGAGALVGGIGVIPGAIAGGAIGAATGAITRPDEVDLGPPVWKQN
ncbi:MAG: hypothetical protein ACK4QW_06325 [Alphaproteobacteria bacterium]